MTYRCVTHGIEVTVKDHTRTFKTPPGSWAGLPQCHLMLMVRPQEGVYGDCRIERVG